MILYSFITKLNLSRVVWFLVQLHHVASVPDRLAIALYVAVFSIHRGRLGATTPFKKVWQQLIVSFYNSMINHDS